MSRCPFCPFLGDVVRYDNLDQRSSRKAMADMVPPAGMGWRSQSVGAESVDGDERD